jgi:hypothetical protein
MDIAFLNMLRTKLAVAIFNDNVGNNVEAYKLIRELLVVIDNELERCKNESNNRPETTD